MRRWRRRAHRPHGWTARPAHRGRPRSGCRPPTCRPVRRGHRQPRSHRPGRTIVDDEGHAEIGRHLVGQSGPLDQGAVEEHLSRSWTMSTPPLITQPGTARGRGDRRAQVETPRGQRPPVSGLAHRRGRAGRGERLAPARRLKPCPRPWPWYPAPWPRPCPAPWRLLGRGLRGGFHRGLYPSLHRRLDCGRGLRLRFHLLFVLADLPIGVAESISPPSGTTPVRPKGKVRQYKSR